MKTELFIDQYGGEFISSRSNGTVVSLAKLSDKKNRDEMKMFLSEGVKLAEEALLHSEVDCLIFSETAVKEGKKEVLALAEQGRNQNIRMIVAGEPAFAKLTSEKSPQGVIAVSRYLSRHGSAEMTDFTSWQMSKRILILDKIQDPGNMGTMIRSAVAMGFTGILAVGCTDIYSTKTLRASMGAVLRCDILRTDDPVLLIKALRNNGRRVLAAALGQVSFTLGEIELSESDCVVIGNEGHGISDDVLSACDAALKIPMTDGSESLNASAAAAIIMWEYHKKFG